MEEKDLKRIEIAFMEAGLLKSDYPEDPGKVISEAIAGDEVILLTDKGKFFPARHVCQKCKSPLIVTDYFDYICNKCSGAF